MAGLVFEGAGTREIVFELCAETVAACVAARDGGAHRIELCSGLSEGGITPSHGLVRAAVKRSGLPVHVLVRPRGGDFFYSEDEAGVMRDDILHVKELGAAGVVLGMLKLDATVDVDGTKRLVEAAQPMEVTFHRAIDATREIEGAFEDAISTGCDRVLTSGGASDVATGAAMLARLVNHASGRIAVALGGGLRLENAAQVAEITGARHFHGSLQSYGRAVNASVVREMMDELRKGVATVTAFGNDK